MKRYLVYITIATVISVMALPSFAGRPKGGGSSSIALASDSTARSGGPALGSAVRFTTTVEPLAGWEWPMVQVDCKQGDVLVWSTLMRPDESAKLGGDASDWLTAGGEANCTAYLLAIGAKGGKQSSRWLAVTAFAATA